MNRRLALVLAALCGLALAGLAVSAPERMPEPVGLSAPGAEGETPSATPPPVAPSNSSFGADPGVIARAASPEEPRSVANLGPSEVPPFGTDGDGRPLLAYASQGAGVILLPSVVAALLIAGFAVVGGLLRCVGNERVDGAVQSFSEVVGALPRMVVVLIVALVLPTDWRGLMPLALTWAVLSAPGAMDEAASVAERLGGARFVEALRAHGFSWSRIFLYHIVGLNLRPVVVRQAAETAMQVTFLELSLSYLAIASNSPSLTHRELVKSWADILYMGYRYPALGEPTGHALALGLGLVGLVAASALLLTNAARAR